MRLDPSFPHTPGETPASFVSRLARINGLASGRELCKDLGISYDGLVAGKTDSIRRICELTGSEVEPLLCEARSRDGNRYRVRGQALVVASFVGANVRICPACLAEDGRTARNRTPGFLAAYGRTAWTVTHLRTCPDHEVALIDLPGTSRATVQDFASVVVPWIDRGSSTRLQPRQRSPSAFEGYLLDRLEGRSIGCWLDEMPFYAAARTCEMLGAAAIFGRKARLKTLGTGDWAAAGAEGFAAISSDLTALDEFLANLISTYPGDRATPVGPMAWFGRFYEWLDYVTTDPAYDPIRTAMVRCIAERAPFNPNERMFGKPVPYRKVHSLRSAAHETGLDAKRLRRALNHAGHLAPGHEVLPDHEVTFDASAASDLLRLLVTARTLADVASDLEISWMQARQLQRAGHLRVMDKEVTGTSSPCFAAAEVEAFLAKLRTGAEEVAVVPKGACDLRAASKRAQCSVDDVVGLVAGGTLAWVGHLAGVSGLRSILIDVAEIRGRMRRPELEGYTRREVELMLGVPTRTVNALIERGFLGTSVQRHPTVPRDIVVIGTEDLDRFRERYVRMTEAAEMLGIPLPRVPDALLARGIEPALTKAEFYATFYKRTMVTRMKTDAPQGR